jgi:hypothetical protein
MIFRRACRRRSRVDHDRSGVASAAWFRRRQSGESGGGRVAIAAARLRRRPGRRRPAQSRRGETGDEAGVMDTVPRDSRCSSGPIMQSYSPTASGVSDTPIGPIPSADDAPGVDTPASALGFGELPGSHASGFAHALPVARRFISRRTDASLHVIRYGFGISISLPCVSARSTLWWAVTTSSSGRRAAITGLSSSAASKAKRRARSSRYQSGCFFFVGRVS